MSSGVGHAAVAAIRTRSPILGFAALPPPGPSGSAAWPWFPAIAAATAKARTRLSNRVRMRSALLLAGLVRKTRIFVCDQV